MCKKKWVVDTYTSGIFVRAKQVQLFGKFLPHHCLMTELFKELDPGDDVISDEN